MTDNRKASMSSKTTLDWTPWEVILRLCSLALNLDRPICTLGVLPVCSMRD